MENSNFQFPGLGFHLLKAGPGVIGRTAPVAIASIIAFSFAFYITKDNDLLFIAVFLIFSITIILYIVLSFNYANKHPNHSVLEGAQLVRHAEIQAASSSEIVEGSSTPVPNKKAPKAITSEQNDA